MQGLLKYIRKQTATVPRIYHHQFKPKDFSYNLNDLGKLYALRHWQLENTTSNDQRIEVTREMEELHNEMNYLNSRRQVYKFLGFAAFWFAFLYIYAEPNETRLDFRKNFDQKYTLKLYMDLDEGGFEMQ